MGANPEIGFSDLDLQVGPVADRVTVWPQDGGFYGVDATFQGLSGHGDLEQHERVLKAAEVRYSVRQEQDGGWTLRFGPVNHRVALRLVESFIV